MIKTGEARILAWMAVSDMFGKEYFREHFGDLCSCYPVEPCDDVEYKYFMGFEGNGEYNLWTVFAWASINRETKEVTFLDYRTPDGKRMENPIKPVRLGAKSATSEDPDGLRGAEKMPLLSESEATTRAWGMIAGLVGREYFKSYRKSAITECPSEPCEDIDYEYFMGFEKDKDTNLWTVFVSVMVNRKTRAVTLLDYRTPDGKRMENPIKPIKFAAE